MERESANQYADVIDFLVNLVDEFGTADLVVPDVDPTLVALASTHEWPRTTHRRAPRPAAGV